MSAHVWITIDEENNGDEFWECAREPLASLKIGDTLVLTEAEWAKLLPRLENLPGWDDGPTFASNPILWKRIAV